MLDLFAAEGVLEPLPGGQGTSWRAGDLVLKSGHDGSGDWIAPIQARLAVRLDEESPRSLRLALPVPARDGSVSVDGWTATRFEPGATPCHDLATLRATARLLHARLAVAVPERPEGLEARDDQWSRAEQAAYDPHLARLAAAERPEAGLADLVRDLVAALDDTDLGREQLVHSDLAGNVLLDAAGVPFVIDFSPTWRSPLWAEAVCVLDAVLWHDADEHALGAWRIGQQRQAMLRAAIFRVLSDIPCDVGRYPALGLV
ncbi:aminoglycoside phosphotransferase [Nocardioides currus]|uniref:Aminoglycoside phosphotransferase n=1 Tax=Nocardioides currus TaxID=2133958 RepID=A0A2R7YUL4_9ACTN|nr:aminoglycoside phosphotransferase [Nocardioides currus]